jgi:hypothetical protein
MSQSCRPSVLARQSGYAVGSDQNCLGFLSNKLGKGSLKDIRSVAVKTHQRERGFGLGGPARAEEGTPAGAVELCTRVMRLPS